MWLEITTRDPAYASGLFDALTGYRQAGVQPDGSWPLIGRAGRTIGRISGSDLALAVPVFELSDVERALADVVDTHTSRLPEFGGQPVHLVTDPEGNRFGLSQAVARDRRAPTWPPDGLFAELVTTKPQPMAHFYSSLLGVAFRELEVESDEHTDMDPWAGYRLIMSGHDVYGGMIDSTFFDYERDTRWVTYIEVADTAAAVTKAVDYGCRTLVPPSDSPHGIYAVIQDPDGLIWPLGQTAILPESSRAFVNHPDGGRVSIRDMLLRQGIVELVRT